MVIINSLDVGGSSSRVPPTNDTTSVSKDSHAVVPKRPIPESWQMGTANFNNRMQHHDGIKALWESKWCLPCSKGVYPFHDGEWVDFVNIFQDLIRSECDDGTSKAYTEAFFSTAKDLEEQGDKILATVDDRKKGLGVASQLYLRAACVLRIARFPYITSFPEPSCPVKWKAWEWQKRVYMKAASTWKVPITEVSIPHKHRAGRDRDEIPAYVRVPAQRLLGAKYPTVLLFTGLDGYRPDNTGRCNEFLARGWAAVILEIPGTADCPADPADPASPDRLWDSVFAWMATDGRFDLNRVMCWGLSAGGYYAIRVAHTHAKKLAGVVAQGAGSHYFFSREWLEKADGHEYPFKLLPALAQKHGFDSVEAYLDGAQCKFSLLETGILEKPCTKLLLVNGTRDGLMPIEDSMLLFEYGSPKEARFFNGLHMGYPDANASVYPWMEGVMTTRGSVCLVQAGNPVLFPHESGLATRVMRESNRRARVRRFT